MKQSFMNAEDYEVAKPVKAAPITAAEFQALIDRKARRNAEIDPLMAKMERAESLGFDLNERDKKRLLALLLTDVIDGTGR